MPARLRASSTSCDGSIPFLVRRDVSNLRRQERTRQPRGRERRVHRSTLRRTQPDPELLAERRWQRRERESRDSFQDRAPFRLGRRVVEELGNLAGRLGHPQLPAVDHAGHVRAELRNRRRDDLARNLDELGGEHLLLVEPLTPGVIQLPDRQLLEQQRGVDQARVHPEQQVRIERVVRLARDLIDTLDPRVDVVDAIGGDVRLSLGPERDGVREDQSALQPFPGVPLVEPRLSSARDHQRMRGLHQHRAGTTEQDRDLPMDLPTDATRSEVTEIAVVAHDVTVSAAAGTTGG